MLESDVFYGALYIVFFLVIPVSQIQQLPHPLTCNAPLEILDAASR